MQALGDFRVSTIVYFKWNSNAVAGESVTRATNGTIRIYKNGSTTERTSSNGITDTEDFDTLTGVHHCSIDLSDNTDAGFYAAGNDYDVVLATATIDGKSINASLAHFSIENRNPQVDVTKWLGTAAATPTVAGVPEVDVTHFNGVAGTFSGGRPEVNTSHLGGSAIQQSGGYIKVSEGTGTGQIDLTAGRPGIDWAKISNPTTVVGLSGTTVKTATDVETDTQDIQSRLPAALTAGGNMKSDALAISGDTTAADNLEAALDGTGGVTITANITGNITGNLSGTIGGFTTSAKAEIESEVNDALVVHRLDELINADSDIDGAAPPAVGSVVFEMLTKTTGSFTFDQTTDSLEAIRDNMSAGAADWTSGERDQIRKALGVTGTTAATTGTGNLDAVKTKTDQLTFTVANRVDATAASGTLGSGSKDVVLNVKDTSLNVLAGVDVWVTTGTDPQTGIVAGTVVTDAFGNAPTIFLDPGTYRWWAQLAGYNFTNPQTIVVV